jgi:hypothetical protein
MVLVKKDWSRTDGDVRFGTWEGTLRTALYTIGFLERTLVYRKRILLLPRPRIDALNCAVGEANNVSKLHE